MDKIFCNVNLFRVPRSWTGSFQMKSSMPFIRGNRYIERKKDNSKSREVKRLKLKVMFLFDEYWNNCTSIDTHVFLPEFSKKRNIQSTHDVAAFNCMLISNEIV